jgi:hypothetical protein
MRNEEITAPKESFGQSRFIILIYTATREIAS